MSKKEKEIFPSFLRFLFNVFTQKRRGPFLLQLLVCIYLSESEWCVVSGFAPNDTFCDTAT